MNKNFYTHLLLVLIPLLSHSQDHYEVKLADDTLNIDGQFYISNVIDNRSNKHEIGMVYSTETGSYVRAVLPDELEKVLESYFSHTMAPAGEKTPVTLVIRQLEIGEKKSGTLALNYATISADFYVEDKRVFRNKQRVQVASRGQLKPHEANIRKALERILTTFHYSDWRSMANKGVAMHPDLGTKERARHIIAVGYQIGGLTYAGIEYELRLDEYLGVNIGAGIKGYTAGLKIHTSPRRNSPFLHINYKDRGFGSLGIGALELGGKVPFSRRENFGFHGQLGLGKVLTGYPSTEFRNFSHRPVPAFLLTLGLGLSW